MSLQKYHSLKFSHSITFVTLPQHNKVKGCTEISSMMSEGTQTHSSQSHATQMRRELVARLCEVFLVCAIRGRTWKAFSIKSYLIRRKQTKGPNVITPRMTRRVRVVFWRSVLQCKVIWGQMCVTLHYLTARNHQHQQQTFHLLCDLTTIVTTGTIATATATCYTRITGRYCRIVS